MIIDFLFWHLLQRWQVVKLFRLFLGIPYPFVLHVVILFFIINQPAEDIEEVPDFVLSHDQDAGISPDNKNQSFR